MDLDRRSFLTLAGASVLSGCTTPGQAPPEDWRRPAQACCVLMLQNMGGGHRMDGSGEGVLVFADPDTGASLGADLPYEPIDQAMMCSRAGRAGWVTAAGTHLLSGERITTHLGLPVNGSVHAIAPTETGFLACLNGGAEFGMVSFDAQDVLSWTHPGWIDSVAWTEGHAFGFASDSLRGEALTLRNLSPGTFDKPLGEALGETTVLWGGVAASDGMLASMRSAGPGEPAFLVRTHTADGAEEWFPDSSAVLDASGWPEGPGPENLILLGDRLYWSVDEVLWRADIMTGDLGPVRSLAPDGSAGASWFLSDAGAVGVEKDGGAFRMMVSVGLESPTGPSVSVEVEGPGDLSCVGAAYLPALG